jgi:beta-glucosidase
MGPRTVEYRESVYVGYRYFDAANKPVQYPFGYGLSYTTFEYSDLRLSSGSIEEQEGLNVSFRVKNTGAVAGAEVAQLYVAAGKSAVFRPEKELKGFVKVFLQPGEEKEVAVALDARAFAYYNTLIHGWHVEGGVYRILVGASSRDIRLTANVTVASASSGAPVPDDRQAAPWYYDPSALEASAISDAQFEAVLGRKLIPNKPYQMGELTANNSIGQIACSGFGRFLGGVVKLVGRFIAIGMENKDMITRSIIDMPLRSLSGFTGGAFTEQAVDGLVDMCNGTKGGFRKFLAGLNRKAR